MSGRGCNCSGPMIIGTIACTVLIMLIIREIETPSKNMSIVPCVIFGLVGIGFCCWPVFKMIPAAVKAAVTISPERAAQYERIQRPLPYIL